MHRETRNSIEDIWGPRTPYEGEGQWPQRIDEQLDEEPQHWVQSACVLCANGRALDIGVKDNRIVGVRGRGIDRANHAPDRLKRPLLRKGDGFVEISWDEAMEQLVAKTKEVRDQFTGGAIGFYNSGQLFLEEYYTLCIIAHAGLGTNHLDGNTRLCTATASIAMRETFGTDGQPCSYADVDVTDCFFIIGSDMAMTKTVLWMRLLDRRRPPPEQPDQDYPFWLTTGRIVCHFHTRTKTGRSPQLQQAAPESFVEMAAEDAERLGVHEGDLVEVSSRRGTVRGPARIGDILPGHLFIPFHYGYWDESDPDCDRAANELTATVWDPVSKQPLYKTAAVQLRKAGTVQPSLGQRAADAASKVVDRGKELVDKVLSSVHESRSHVPDHIGLLAAANEEFIEACQSVAGHHVDETEIHYALSLLEGFSHEALETLKPFQEKYGRRDSKEPKELRKTLLSSTHVGSLGLLRDLQNLFVLGTEIEVYATAILQTAQALRDPDLLNVCSHLQEQNKRQLAWLNTQIMHRAPHTLMVPA